LLSESRSSCIYDTKSNEHEANAQAASAHEGRTGVVVSSSCELR
jgi:hypothetical protein